MSDSADDLRGRLAEIDAKIRVLDALRELNAALSEMVGVVVDLPPVVKPSIGSRLRRGLGFGPTGAPDGGWYPGATRMDGSLAGYGRGRSSMAFVAAHYTVGRDSTAIGLRGYFNFLVRRNGEIVQFAEADAVNWHACEWNRLGPGIEVEYYEPSDGPEIITPAAEAALAGLWAWLADFWAIPSTYYDGPRLAVGSAATGLVAHRALHENACDEHYDYWPADVVARIQHGGPAPGPPVPSVPRGDPKMRLAQCAEDPNRMECYGDETWEVMLPQEYLRLAGSGMPHAEEVGAWVMDAWHVGRRQVGMDAITGVAADVDGRPFDADDFAARLAALDRAHV